MLSVRRRNVLQMDCKELATEEDAMERNVGRRLENGADVNLR